MNTRKGKTKFKKILIILDSGFSSMILIGRLVKKMHPEKDDLIQWHILAGNITTNIKVKVDFTVPALSATNAVTWKYYVDDSAKGRYDMILVQNILI